MGSMGKNLFIFLMTILLVIPTVFSLNVGFDTGTDGGVQNVNININTDAAFNDTNASTACTGTDYLAGDGTCRSAIAGSDTNETGRFNNLTGTDCPSGQLVIGVQNDGTVLCATDQTGGGGGGGNPFDQSLNTTDNVQFQNLTLGQKITFTFGEIIDNIVDGVIKITGNLTVTGSIKSSDWSNVSITESQISNLNHFTGSDITGNEGAFNGWDKDSTDDFTDIKNFTGTLTDTKYCTYDGTNNQINCTSNGGTSNTYYGGTGIEVNASNNISILLGYQIPQGCNDGEIPEYNTSSGGWDCGIDNTAASGMSNWVLAASDTGGSATITDGQTVTFSDDNAYLNATRSGNTIILSLYENKLNSTIDARDSDTTYSAGTGIILTGTTFSVNTTYLNDNFVGQNEYPNLDTDVTDDFDGAWGSLSGVPSGFSDNVDNDSGSTLTHLSNFTDDLGDRGYTHLTNFTDDLGDRGYTHLSNFTIDINSDNIPEGSTNLYDNQSWNESYADTKYSQGSHTVDTNVLTDGTYNSTEFDNTGSQLNIVLSWLTSFIDNWFGGKTTDNLPEGSVNHYDNQSWNESYADTKYSQGSHTVDTNETTRFDTFANTDCSGTDKMVGVDANGNVVCSTDIDTDSNLTETDVEGFIFDNDNNANFNMSSNNITFDGGTIYSNSTCVKIDGSTAILEVC